MQDRTGDRLSLCVRHGVAHWSDGRVLMREPEPPEYMLEQWREDDLWLRDNPALPGLHG